MTRVAIIAAMPGEFMPLVHGWPHERRNGVDLWRRHFEQGEWVAACAGAGVDAAARAFAEVEKDGAISSVVSIGWAGALGQECAPGRAFTVSGVIDIRTGERFPISNATEASAVLKGHSQESHGGGFGKTPLTEQEVSGHDFSRAETATKAKRALTGCGKTQALYQGTTSVVPQVPQNKGRALAPGGCRLGDSPPLSPFSAACLAPQETPSLWLATSPRVADEAEKRRLAGAYGAALVDMEASGVARLAAMRGLPFHCIKGVTDGLTDRLPDFNRFLSPRGRFQLVRLLLYALPRPWYWPGLMRMGENSKRASQSIAELLHDFLDERGHIGKQNDYSNLKR